MKEGGGGDREKKEEKKGKKKGCISMQRIGGNKEARRNRRKNIKI